MDDEVRGVMRGQQQMSEGGEGVTGAPTAEKSPWGWGTLFAVSFLGGWAAGGIIAGINWRRMGRRNLMWPTIIVSVVTFLVWLFVPWPEDPSLVEGIGGLTGLAVAGGLWLWQKGALRAWQQSHPLAHRAGWQIPVLTVIVVSAISLGLLFGGGLGVLSEAEKHYNAGVDLDEQGRYDEAIEEYTKAIELDPKLVLAYNNRAFTYIDKGELDKAIVDCDKAIQLDPKLDLAYFNRGRAYAFKGELDRAISDFSKGIELNPQDAVAYLLRGACYADKGQVTNAVSDLEKCIELSNDPNIVSAAQEVLDLIRQ